MFNSYVCLPEGIASIASNSTSFFVPEFESL